MPFGREPGYITKCSDSTDEGNLGKLPRRWSNSQFNLRLRSRRVFPVISGTYALIMNVSESLVLK